MTPPARLVTASQRGCGRVQTSRRRTPAPQASASAGPATPTVEVVHGRLAGRSIRSPHLEGELTPYEGVALFARATGSCPTCCVDRGTHGEEGAAPRRRSSRRSSRAQRAEAEAKLLGDKATFERLKAASQTAGRGRRPRGASSPSGRPGRPGAGRFAARHGAIPDGDRAVRRRHHRAQRSSRRARRPAGGGERAPMLRIEQVHKLRLTVPVPESLVGAIAGGHRRRPSRCGRIPA